MKTKAERIKFYEDRLEKVKGVWGEKSNQTCHQKEIGAEYIKYAEDQLEAVKNGRDW